jgi:hypothetical protein
MRRTTGFAAALAAVCPALCLLTDACLTRPVTRGNPVTKTNFEQTIPVTAVDKIDLLFDIDNSASMGDKQQYLVQAIPDLIDRLVNPNCLDANGNGRGPSANGVCPDGQTPEFRPVHDMHIAMVTSALGPRLGDQVDHTTGQPNEVCNPAVLGNDDQGHLVARSLATPPDGGAPMATAIADALAPGYSPAPSGFLDWYPLPSPSPASSPPAGLAVVTDATKLESDFAAVVGGAGVAGCGIESQLESWYRFLVQPDPYAGLKLVDNPTNPDGPKVARWDGVDGAILRERKDFLRSDSLVAVVVLTDENDSEIDVRSLGGLGYVFMGSKPLPRATGACDADPASAACGSCSVDSSDPACAAPTQSPPYRLYSARNDWGYDPNLRHVHMKAKYGVDPQYPIQRYAIGLTSTLVPDRAGEYPPGAGGYQGTNDCVNPLFADSLPDGSDTSPATLCHLAVGPRDGQKDLIYYAVIGGVPHELLHFTPGDPDASQLSDADWTRMLGKGPAATTMTSPPSYDYSGIDPHMIEDYRDRSTVAYPFPTDSSLTAAPRPASAAGESGVNGREWITDAPSPPPSSGGHAQPIDLQYACTFKLATPRDCTRPENATACDCPAVAGTLTHDQTSPVCDDANPTLQTYAKAYPTPRELLIARLMGKQGVVSSLCPIHVTDQGTPGSPDPLYGYRPAVAAIVDRLKQGLNRTCIPQRVGSDVEGGNGDVPCVVLVTMPVSNGGRCDAPVCDATRGLTVPPPQVLAPFCKRIADPDRHSVCELRQLTPELDPADFAGGSCETGAQDPGWCYVTGGAQCAQSVHFTRDALPSGSLSTLDCIEVSPTLDL